MCLFEHLNLSRYIGLNGAAVSAGDAGQQRAGAAGAAGAGMTLGFSLSVLAGYYIVFLALSWFVFTKRDVAA